MLPEPPAHLGENVATLARAWVATRAGTSVLEEEYDVYSSSDADLARADEAAAYIVSVYDSPAVMVTLRQLGADFPFAVALTRFADASSAALDSLVGPELETALKSAFSLFVEEITRQTVPPTVGS